MQIRYLGFSNHTPSLNMSIDGLFFNRALESSSAAVLRFFTFSPGCISIGKNQKVDNLPGDLQNTALELIRRPTGGGAVLHDGDMCYSIILPEACLRTNVSLLESYRLITDGLKQGFGTLGINLEYGKDYKQAHEPLCFARTLGYELSFNGRKIIGSAQRRAKGILLQQGAIMPYHNIPYSRLNEKLVSALLEGLKLSLCIDYVDSPLTEEEVEAATLHSQESIVRPAVSPCTSHPIPLPQGEGN
jgi:lipoyl(octanoyl) transferase